MENKEEEFFKKEEIVNVEAKEEEFIKKEEIETVNVEAKEEEFIKKEEIVNVVEKEEVELQTVPPALPVDYKYKVAAPDSRVNVYDSSGKVVASNKDAVKSIQYALDHLTSGRTVQEKVLVVGNFSATNTIKLPSVVIFELQGSIKLADHIDKWLVTEKSGGATNIYMVGGTYDGNKSKQNSKATNDHVIRFTKVTNSHFKDMIIQNAVNDNFTLDVDCNNNLCENLIGRLAGTGKSTTNDGNGLDDKGDHNTWINCIAENNFSDCWVIKCNNSTFQGCIGRGSKNTVGFGYFIDKDHPTANGNKFLACQAYNNSRSGIAINIPSTADGIGGQIQNNFIQGEFYSNGTSGIRFTNSTKDGIVANIELDIYCHNNSANGILISPSKVKIITGSIVAINDKPSDIDIQNGTNCAFDVFIPIGTITNIKQGTNTIHKINFSCDNVPDKFCTKRYCGVV